MWHPRHGVVVAAAAAAANMCTNAGIGLISNWSMDGARLRCDNKTTDFTCFPLSSFKQSVLCGRRIYRCSMLFRDVCFVFGF